MPHVDSDIQRGGLVWICGCVASTLYSFTSSMLRAGVLSPYILCTYGYIHTVIELRHIYRLARELFPLRTAYQQRNISVMYTFPLECLVITYSRYIPFLQVI